LGQISWNCEDDVWGGFVGIVKTICAAEVVEFRRRCVRKSRCNFEDFCGQSWWNFEGCVWGRVAGIVKTVFGAEEV